MAADGVRNGADEAGGELWARAWIPWRPKEPQAPGAEEIKGSGVAISEDLAGPGLGDRPAKRRKADVAEVQLLQIIKKHSGSCLAPVLCDVPTRVYHVHMAACKDPRDASGKEVKAGQRWGCESQLFKPLVRRACQAFASLGWEPGSNVGACSPYLVLGLGLPDHHGGWFRRGSRPPRAEPSWPWPTFARRPLDAPGLDCPRCGWLSSEAGHDPRPPVAATELRSFCQVLSLEYRERMQMYHELNGWSFLVISTE
eukprot:Skav207514  [mRNA]  locus=scaffold907:82168:83638:- [translate_table: standard]